MPDLDESILSDDAHDTIDKIFSKKMLGAFLIATSGGKIVEKIILLNAVDTFEALIGWTVAFILAVIVYIYWERIEARIDAYRERRRANK